MPIQPKIRAALGLQSAAPVANGVTPGMNGLFGQMTQQANAAARGLPGFNYVPPQVGPAPAPMAPGAPGMVAAPSMRDLSMLAFAGAGGGGGADATDMQKRLYALNNRPRHLGSGSDRGGYSTSGRGWGGGSSSARGGGFGF